MAESNPLTALLQGIRGVSVTVSVNAPDNRVTADSVREMTELMLRVAHLPVVEDGAEFNVSLTLFEVGPPFDGYIGTSFLTLMDRVTPLRAEAEHIVLTAPVWMSDISPIFCNQLEIVDRVRQIVSQATIAFANQFLAANPGITPNRQ